eukprot:3483495-Rhodomonas_salina.1
MDCSRTYGPFQTGCVPTQRRVYVLAASNSAYVLPRKSVVRRAMSSEESDAVLACAQVLKELSSGLTEEEVSLRAKVLFKPVTQFLHPESQTTAFVTKPANSDTEADTTAPDFSEAEMLRIIEEGLSNPLPPVSLPTSCKRETPGDLSHDKTLGKKEPPPPKKGGGAVRGCVRDSACAAAGLDGDSEGADPGRGAAGAGGEAEAERRVSRGRRRLPGAAPNRRSTL